MERSGEDARHAIVTGADSGIGRAVAVALAAGGMDVGITYHGDEEGARETAAEVRRHGRRAEVVAHDLTRLPEAADAVDALADALGGVDVFVNNAGGGAAASPALELSFDEWRRVIDLNLNGAFLCAQRAARRMVAAGRGGRIVNISSVHEHVPLRDSAAYCAAKAGLGGLTGALALELAPHGITVNAVAPGETATPMTGAEDEDPRRLARPRIPLGRPGDAREVAAAVAYLASDAAAYTTGVSLAVDGGMLLMAAVANQDDG